MCHHDFWKITAPCLNLTCCLTIWVIGKEVPVDNSMTQMKSSPEFCLLPSPLPLPSLQHNVYTFAQCASHLTQHIQLPTHPSLPIAREGTRISEGSLSLPQGLDCSWFTPQNGELSRANKRHLTRPSPYVLQKRKKNVKEPFLRSSPSSLSVACSIDWTEGIGSI